MPLSIRHLVSALCLGGVLGKACAAPSLHDQPLSVLEQRLTEIDEEMGRLAHFTMRGGMGAIGFRSKTHPDPHHTEWFEIRLAKPTPLDQIVLVPSIWRNKRLGYEADGFPLTFRILAGHSPEDEEGEEIASFTGADQLLPRIAPLVIPCNITTSWVRVEATELSSNDFLGHYDLELAEIMLFSGRDNVALHQPVSTSPGGHEAGARQKRFLVDGLLPYLMDSGRGDQTLAFVSISPLNATPSITIDLGTPHALDQLQLHPVDFNDTVPQSSPAGFAIPPHLLVEGAQHADFSDARELASIRQKSIYDAGPLVSKRFPKTPSRYVRLTAVEPYIFPEDSRKRSRLGFAEIELYANGKNVALHRPATGNQINSQRSLATLTDGSNLYGTILPTRHWMGELSRRHDLEKERPLVYTELNRRYARQQITLQRFGWLTALLVASIALIVLLGRFLRLRQITRLKEQVAADLHDELGANLHTIGLLSDLSSRATNSPEQLAGYLERIRVMTERSGAATRHITNMLEAEGFCSNVVEDMRLSADRLLADLDVDLSLSGESWLQRLSPRRRIDLFLFSKECLTNILRHSEATRVTILLAADKKNIHLTITDNGRGMSGEADQVPSSVKRRARILRGRVTVEPGPKQGTCIKLHLKTRAWSL